MRKVAQRGVFGRYQFAAPFEHAVTGEKILEVIAVRVHTTDNAVTGFVNGRLDTVMHQPVRGAQPASASADDGDFGLAAAAMAR